MVIKLSVFDPAEYLGSDEAIAGYLNEVIAEDDADLLLSALGDIARARGMTHVAEASGLSRESLYKALRPGAKPGFATISKLVSALGVRLVAAPMVKVTAKKSEAIHKKAGKQAKASKAARASRAA